MKFYEALKTLEEGKKIRCVQWDKSDYWNITDSDAKIWNDCFYRTKLAILCNWEIYDELGLCFSEIIEGLKNGKHYRRKSWNTEAYIKCSILSCEVTDHWDLFFKFTIDDIAAKDWECV